MQTFLLKLRLLFLPFLLIVTGFAACYSLLHWLLVVKGDLSLKDDVVRQWLPMLLALLPVVTWLNPRIRLLNLTTKKGNYGFFYFFIAWLSMVVTTVIAQFYITTASGKLTALDNITGIEGKPETMYYTLTNYYVDKNNPGVYYSTEVGGKNREDLTFTAYVAMPIFKSAKDTLENGSYGWLGIKYSEKISNRLSDREKQSKFKAFTESNLKNYGESEVPKFVYLRRAGNNKDRPGFEKAAANSEKMIYGDPAVFLPVNEPFGNRNGDQFAWIFGALAIAATIWLIMILIPSFNKERLDKRLKNIRDEEESDIENFVRFLIPGRIFFVMPVIIIINLVVFVAMVLTGLGFATFQAADLFLWGANYRPSILNGEWWRLITGIFLHGGFLHLLLNSIGLVFGAMFLEPVLRKWRFALVYLLTGIVASITSIWWHPASISAGSSGAIFGVFGVLIVFLLSGVLGAEIKRGMLIAILAYVGINLLLGLFGNADNAAHIGGLLSGAVLGLLLAPSTKREIEEMGPGVDEFPL